MGCGPSRDHVLARATSPEIKVCPSPKREIEQHEGGPIVDELEDPAAYIRACLEEARARARTTSSAVSTHEVLTTTPQLDIAMGRGSAGRRGGKPGNMRPERAAPAPAHGFERPTASSAARTRSRLPPLDAPPCPGPSSPDHTRRTPAPGKLDPPSPEHIRQTPAGRKSPRPLSAPVSTPRRSTSCAPRPSTDLEARLSCLVGQEQIKRELLQLQHALRLDQRRKREIMHEMGRQAGSGHRATAAQQSPLFRPQHYLFMGQPGTGKTRIAREMAITLRDLGVLARGHLVEVQRSDLVASAIGKTAEQTRAILRQAAGGVLFVDEAYQLIKPHSDKDYGVEALEELMRGMDEGETVMIFAGYSSPMKVWMEANAGLYRRISKQFYFDDYLPSELSQMVLLLIGQSGFHTDGSVTADALTALITTLPAAMRSRMNGGVADSLLKLGKESLDRRLTANCDAKSLCRYKLEDFQKASAQMRAQWGAAQQEGPSGRRSE